MINMMLGGPRSGKSYESVVYHVLPALESGRKVVTNLPLNMDAFEALNPEYKKLVRIIQNKGLERAFSRQEHWHDSWKDPSTNRGPLFVVDECHDIMRRNETPRWLKELAAMHGHYGYDWLLITQSHGKVDKEICDMVQFTYYVRKKLAWGQPDAYIRKVYDGLKGRGSEECEVSERAYKTAYFKFYKSHTHSAGAVTEFTGSDVSSKYRKWKIATWSSFGLFLFFVAGAFITWLLDDGKKVEQGASKTVSQPVVSRNVSSHALASAPAPDYVARAATANDMTRHPFEGMHLHIKGSIVSPTRQTWLFAISRDGKEIMHQTGIQLGDAGYSIRAVNECLAIIDHPRLQRPFYVYCEAPAPASPGAASAPASKIAIPTPAIGKLTS